jgi:hypothetical protein
MVFGSQNTATIIRAASFGGITAFDNWIAPVSR